MNKVDLNKDNLMRAVLWIIRNDETILLDKQYQLAFFSNEDIQKIEYCIKTLESLVEDKQIYNKQKIG